MPKLKQKVASAFHPRRRGHFLYYRSYLATLRKQSRDLFESLVLTFKASLLRLSSLADGAE
ncbi:MAG: hypothetical protein M3436_03830 [Pseudomonadota bacterium]|nr:hypothetical protein [Pseudomonadota bacterium]